jgi:hypothetical protein
MTTDQIWENASDRQKTKFNYLEMMMKNAEVAHYEAINRVEETKEILRTRWAAKTRTEDRLKELSNRFHAYLETLEIEMNGDAS